MSSQQSATWAKRALTAQTGAMLTRHAVPLAPCSDFVSIFVS